MTHVCPKCGKGLKVNAPEGLCPRCLMQAAIPHSAPVESPIAKPGVDLEANGAVKRLGDFELGAELARGGMGVVYRARQMSLNRSVALKLILAGEWASPDAIARFHNEAQAAARLDHPHIVTVYESGEHEGQCYLAMKLVMGENLGQKAARERLWGGGSVGPSPGGARTKSESQDRWARVVAVMVKLARAVHYAHQRGVLHRDIKPANILLDEEGNPHLTDFGLARWVEQDSQLTHTRAVLGTPAYISPEQAEGKSRSLTTSTDVYGLGAVLYELLTGEPPFGGGTTYETIRQVLEREPRKPSQLCPGMDRDLETLCLKCLEKDPLRRYGSAEALADDLERWLRGEPVRARPVSRWEQVRKWVKREPARAWSAALGLVALISIAVVSTVLGLRVEAARRDLKHQVEENRQQLVRMNVSAGMRLSENGDSLAALPYLAAALRLDAGDALREEPHRMRLGMMQAMAPQLERIWFFDHVLRDAGFDESETRVAIGAGSGATVHRMDADGREVGPMMHPTVLLYVVLHGKSERLVTVTEGRTVHLWNSADGNEVMEPVTGAALVRPAISGDGQRFVVGVGRGAQQYSLISGAPLGPRLEHSDVVTCVAYSSDGKRLLTTSLDKSARVWDSVTGLPIGPSLLHTQLVVKGWFGMHSNEVATLASPDVLTVFQADDGSVGVEPFKVPGVVVDCRQRSDGAWWVAGVGGSSVRVWDLKARIPIGPWMQHSGGILGAAMGRDGQRLIASSWDDSTRVWNVRSGESATPWMRHSGFVIGQAMSQSGRFWMTSGADKTVRLWRQSPRGGARFIWPIRDAIGTVRWSQQEREIEVVTLQGQRRVLDLTTGKSTLLNSKLSSSFQKLRGLDHPRISMGWMQNEIRMLDWNDSNAVVTLKHPGLIRDAAISPDGRWVASIASDRVLRLWDWTANALEWSAQPIPGEGVRIRFSVEGKQVFLSASDGLIRSYGMEDGTMVETPYAHEAMVVDMDVSADGGRLVSAISDSSLEPRAAVLWDLKTRRRLGDPLGHRDGVLKAVFSKDGKYVVTGSEDYTARVWDGWTGRPVTPALRHAERVEVVAFSPDSRWVASGSSDGNVRVWEAATGSAITPWLVHWGPILSLEFDNGGKRLVVAARDGVRVWDLEPRRGGLTDLQTEAEFLSARRLNAGSELVPVEVGGLSQAWRSVTETRRAQQRPY